MWKPIILDVECIVCNKSLQKINHDPPELTRKMGKIINRRSRTPNWSPDEKQYLLELIKQRKEVVVTQKNNGPNHSEEKDTAWNEILRALAVRFGSKFSASSIKKVKTQWQNMKRIAREEIALVGPTVEKFTKQSFEVCNILDLIQDGVLKGNDNLNETTLTTDVVIKAERIDEDLNQPSCSTSSFPIGNQDSDSQKHDGANALLAITPRPCTFSNLQKHDGANALPVSPRPCAFSNSQKYDGANALPVTPRSCAFLAPEQLVTTNPNHIIMEQSSSSTSSEQSEMHYFEQDEPIPMEAPPAKKNVSSMTEPNPEANVNAFHRELQEFFRYSSAEKQLKMDSLKEERCVVRAMRETAELNKIIAEQKLKHILWVKKQEMS